MGDSALRTVWCGNLSSEVADEILFDLFLQAGPLEKVSIPKERDGRSKGYGFVTFKHECSVPYAMELMKGTTLFGRPINLQNRTGAKVDNAHNDSQTLYHQRSISLEEQVRPHPGLAPNFNPQYFNPLLGMAGLLSANAMIQGLRPQMPQDMMPPSHFRNHPRSRSHHGGDRYHEGNNRDERRDFYNSADRQRLRDNDYRGRPRDNDYHDRFRGSSHRDRDRDRDWDRDRDRRSNHRPYDNRYRPRE